VVRRLTAEWRPLLVLRDIRGHRFVAQLHHKIDAVIALAGTNVIGGGRSRGTVKLSCRERNGDKGRPRAHPAATGLLPEVRRLGTEDPERGPRHEMALKVEILCRRRAC
jgi:hypothetical protein